MVKILNRKPKRFNKIISKSTKKIHKPKPTEKLTIRNNGKLPTFDKSTVVIKFNEQKIKSLVTEIYSKTNSKTDKQESIKNLIGIACQNNAKFVCKKWALKGFESSLKYADSNNKNTILKIVNDNSSRISSCPNTYSLIYKLMKYTIGSNRKTIFNNFSDKILSLFFVKDSLKIGNKIFFMLNKFQKNVLMHKFFKIDQDNEKKSKNSKKTKEIKNEGDKNLDILNSKVFKDDLSLIFNKKADEIIIIIKNYILTAHQSKIISSSFFCYIFSYILQIFPMEHQISILELLTYEDISEIFNFKEGIYIISKYLRICSLESYENIFGLLSKYSDDELLSNDMMIFFISSIYKSEHISIFNEKLLKILLNNFDKCMLSVAFNQLISHIIEPNSRKIIPPSTSDFIRSCDQISNTPNSYIIYSVLKKEISQLLIDYALRNMRNCLTCQYRSNIILQLLADLSCHKDTNMDSLENLYSKISKTVINERENENLLVCNKQVCWFIIKLIHDDISRDSSFVKSIILELNKDLIEKMKENKNFSIIYNLLKKFETRETNHLQVLA